MKKKNNDKIVHKCVPTNLISKKRDRAVPSEFQNTEETWKCVYCGNTKARLPKTKEFECRISVTGKHYYRLIQDEKY
jgi:hypothetical protein